MKGKDLLEAMEYLEDDIIEAAHEDKSAPVPAKRRVFLSLAACFACILLLCAAVILPAVQKAGRKQNEPASTSTEHNVPEYNDWQEILIPSAGEIELTEDIRIISEEDLLDFNLKWAETKDKQWETDEEFDFFFDFMNSHKTQITGKALFDASYYEIADNSHNFLCTMNQYDLSMSAVYLIPTFYSYWAYSNFHMRQSEIEYTESYLEKIKRKRNAVQKHLEYIAQNLDEADYGGSFYDSENDKYTVWLFNESRRENLEQQEIVCKPARYSLQQLYEKMHELWNRREELQILNLSMNDYQNKINVYGTLSEEEFAEKLNYADLYDMILYNSYSDLAGFTTEEALAFSGIGSAIQIEDADAFIKFIQARYLINYSWETFDSSAQEYFDNLKTALIKLKEKYPEYTYLQLYYHISTDCEYEYYLNFDQTLENFISTLPAYKKDMNFLKEQQYGDPQRLGLKAVLYYYKQLYPKESYETLYQTYLAPENLEQNILPKAEKLYHYLYIKALQKEELKQQQKEKTETLSKNLHFLLYIILSCIVIFTALLLCAHFQKKRMEKAEFRSHLIREITALSSNLALFVFLPYILRLTSSPDIMPAIFLPNYYLAPLFGLLGSALYTRRKGHWWNFMLYTTLGILLQPLAMLGSASSTYIFLLYIFPAEIAGTLYEKLKTKIKHPQ